MICQIERLYKALAPQISACLRTLGARKDYHLLNTQASGHCIVRDGPHPGATINIQVGSSLTKGGGGQTKNLGKLVAWLNISSSTNFFTSLTPNPAVGDDSCNVMENIGQMRNRLDSSAHQVAVLIRSWCESGLPLERRFKHLCLQLGFCCLGP